MNTQVQPYTFPDTGQTIRAITDDDELWFVAADVAAVLGYRMASDLTRRLDTDERGTRSVRTPSGDQVMSVVTEPGLYTAILGARVPAARAFKRWVTRDVLPSIRRTGSYSTVPAVPQSYAEALRAAADAVEARQAAEEYAAALEPAAGAWSDLADTGDDYDVREAAQILSRTPGVSVGRTRLFARMRSMGWLDPSGQPYQRHIDMGRLARRTRTYPHPRTGEPRLSVQVRITPKGLTVLRAALVASAQLALTAPGGQ